MAAGAEPSCAAMSHISHARWPTHRLQPRMLMTLRDFRNTFFFAITRLTKCSRRFTRSNTVTPEPTGVYSTSRTISPPSFAAATVTRETRVRASLHGRRAWRPGREEKRNEARERTTGVRHTRVEHDAGTDRAAASMTRKSRRTPPVVDITQPQTPETYPRSNSRTRART